MRHLWLVTIALPINVFTLLCSQLIERVNAEEAHEIKVLTKKKIFAKLQIVIKDILRIILHSVLDTFVFHYVYGRFQNHNLYSALFIIYK